VIITEYDLPSPLIQPHDVVLDREGSVWYSDFGQMFLGKMDPKTGKVTQYPIPVVKPGWSEGTLDLEFDKDDNPWVGVMYQSAIAKFDKKSEKFQMWQTPKEWDTDAGQLGSKIPTAEISTGSISTPTRWRTSAHSRIRAPAGASAPTGFTRTWITTRICSTSPPATSSSSTPRRRT
jgi:sugar lactone lactonase YvrE